jgi:hypothetical protein
MDEREMQATMNAAVALAMRPLDDEAVVALRLSVLLGTDPRQRLGYDAVAHLFTEADGAKMHDETRRAFLAVSAQRLGL